MGGEKPRYRGVADGEAGVYGSWRCSFDYAAVPAPPFHAEMVPFRLAKMKLAAVPFTRKAGVLWLTCPVGP